METTQNIKFEKQESPDHVWVLAFDTMIDGWDCTKNGEGEIALYTKEEIDQELAELLALAIESEREYFEDFVDEYEEGGFCEEDVEDDHFAIHMDEYLHGRKAFFPGGIRGIKPEKQ